MKKSIQLFAATFMLLILQLHFAHATDPYPIRGLYVDKLVRWTGAGFPTIDETRTLLGRTAEEDSLLKFAHDNNFKYLMLYDLSRIFAHPTATLPNSGGRTYEQALCDFMNKARTQYCIENIGAILSSNSYLDSVVSFSNLLITDPYNFGNSQFVPNNPNPLAYVETTYTAADGEIALRSELVKTVLRINDFNSFCSSKFDLITTEYEFWQQNESAGCTILDSIYYKTRDTLVYHGTNITTSITLDNTATITLPQDSINWDGAWRHHPIYLKFCKTNAQFWAYRQLLLDFQTAQAGATHPILLDTYLGWFSNDSINDILQTNVIDSILNQVSIHAYNTHPSWLWGYFDNRDSLFGHNNIPNTIVHPIFSAEPGFSGDSISGGTSWFEIEKTFRTGYAANYSVWHHDNDSMQPGAIFWFAQSFFKTASADTTYKKNKLFIRPSTTCSGSNVFFDYIGPYEGGISFVWNYADGTIDSSYNLAVSAQDKNHTFNNAGTYIVSCTLYYPAPTDTGISGCTPYTYRDTVIINGAAITGSPLSFCDGGSVTLTATGGGTTYQWKKNAANISGATTNTYVATTSGTYSVVVTGLAGCATSTAQVVVTVYSKPEITATPTNVSCPSLCDGSVTTSIVGGTSSFAYSWSSGATTANISSVCINTYTVIVTDSHGCKDTATAVISNPPNSCDMGKDYCGTTLTSNIGSTFPNSSVGLHGNLTVDNNFFIRHTEVKIDSGFVITINSGKTLTISDTSWLHACRSMWQGIILSSSTSHLVIDSASTVEDADTAAKANNGGDIKIIGGTTIRRNLVGVSMKTNNSLLKVNGATFDCPSTLNDTTASKYSDTHILLATTNVDSLSIFIGDSTHHNTFINATKGIDAWHSYLFILNSDFIIDTSIIHTPDSATFGIKFVGDAANTLPYCLNVDNKLIPCLFQNYGNGIYSVLRTLNSIKSNQFDNCNYGVRLETIRDQRSQIMYNTFNSCKRINIFLRDISIGMGWVNVNENYINQSSSATADSSYIGVRVENISTYHTHITVVYNAINNVRFGTHFTNVHQLDASSNTITFPQDINSHGGEEYFGILAENSSGMTINGNTISADSTPTTGIDTVLRGISLDLSTNNLLRQNFFEKMGAGIRVNMNCKPNLLYCNLFDTCRKSIRYENSGNLGDQGSPTTPWDNVFQNNIDPLIVDGDTTSTRSNWYFRGSETDFTNTYNVEPSNVHLVFPFDSVDADKYICDDVEGGGGGGGDRAQSLASMTGANSEGGEFGNEISYMNKSTVYRVLDENDSLMNLGLSTDATLQNFYDENSQTNIAAFQQVNSLGEQGETSAAVSANDNINDTNLIEYNSRIVNEIYFAATQQDTLSLTESQITILQDIAYQNPMEGGEAVYRARAMLDLYISTHSSSVAYRKAKPDYKPRIISADNFRIYPVPAKDYFMIRNNDKQEKKIQFVIFDNTGRTIRKVDTKISEEIFIPTSHLMQGVYSLQIISADRTEMHKLIIVH